MANKASNSNHKDLITHLYVIGELAAVTDYKLQEAGFDQDSLAMKCLRQILELSSLTQGEIDQLHQACREPYAELNVIGVDAELEWVKTQKGRLLAAKVIKLNYAEQEQ